MHLLWDVSLPHIVDGDGDGWTSATLTGKAYKYNLKIFKCTAMYDDEIDLYVSCHTIIDYERTTHHVHTTDIYSPVSLYCPNPFIAVPLAAPQADIIPSDRLVQFVSSLPPSDPCLPIIFINQAISLCLPHRTSFSPLIHSFLANQTNKHLLVHTYPHNNFFFLISKKFVK